MAAAQQGPSVRAIRIAVAGLLACLGVGWGLWYVLAARDGRLPDAHTAAAEVAFDAETEARIRAFCGDCHAVPRPESFHRDAWHDEVELGYDYYARSRRTDLAPPPPSLAAAYFRSRAPVELTYPEFPSAGAAFPASFRPERLDLPADATLAPGIAFLCWRQLVAGEPPALVASDMISGQVTGLDLRTRDRKPRLLAQLNNPCCIEPCDLDQDGRIDLVVGDLGSYAAMDHDRGRVIWLRQQLFAGVYEEVVIASGLGRVTDVRPIDFDADGDLDLVVAEFGWYRTGAVRLYRNVAPRGQRPRFECEVLDPRTGAIHVPVCDLNGDGRQDFVALVSNESECVEAFLNQGSGRFSRQTLWRAPDLTFGSSGIQLVDLDGDGDLDVLYPNGDAFDNAYLSPWHGVQWLENLGEGRFEHRRIVDLAGATIAVPGDLDGDGDLDVLVACFLPGGLKPEAAASLRSPSVVLLEQTARGRFACHALEWSLPSHPAAAVGDFDDDGDLDFAIGNQRSGMGRTWLTLWWNQTKSK